MTCVFSLVVYLRCFGMSLCGTASKDDKLLSLYETVVSAICLLHCGMVSGAGTVDFLVCGMKISFAASLLFSSSFIYSELLVILIDITFCGYKYNINFIYSDIRVMTLCVTCGCGCCMT